MSFYQLLQLDPALLFFKIKSSVTIKERFRYILALVTRNISLVTFAILWVSSITSLFGKQTSSLAIVSFCVLLSLRVVNYGYKVSQGITSLGISLLIFWLAPFILIINYLPMQLICHFIMIISLFFLTSWDPKMGNPGLYSFAYIFIIGTVHYQSKLQIFQSLCLIVLVYLIFAIIYYKKHRDKNSKVSFFSIFKQDKFFVEKHLWFVYYALGISILLFLGNYLNLNRFMWVAFACSSLFSAYDNNNLKERMKDRIIGTVIGASLASILISIIPSSILGIIGGLILGFCCSYRNKTIFNCLGAMVIASTLFGIPTTYTLRIFNNLLGLSFGVLYHVLFIYCAKQIRKKRVNL